MSLNVSVLSSKIFQTTSDIRKIVPLSSSWSYIVKIMVTYLSETHFQTHHHNESDYATPRRQLPIATEKKTHN